MNPSVLVSSLNPASINSMMVFIVLGCPVWTALLMYSCSPVAICNVIALR